MKNLSFFLLFFCFFLFLGGCQSTDSLREAKYEDYSPGAEEREREPASLPKAAPVFDRSNFEFLSEKMRKVVKNYKRMRKKLTKIERKLDIVLEEFQKERDGEIFSAEAESDDEEEAGIADDDIFKDALENIEGRKGQQRDKASLTTGAMPPDSYLFDSGAEGASQESPFAEEAEAGAVESAPSEEKTEPEQKGISGAAGRIQPRRKRAGQRMAPKTAPRQAPKALPKIPKKRKQPAKTAGRAL